MKFLSNRIISTLRLLLFVLCNLVIARILFFIFHDTGEAIDFNTFISGVWFDIVTTSLLFFPWSILYSFPWPKTKPTFWRTLLKIWFLVQLSLMNVFNLADIAFFSFQMKRSTWDLFELLRIGSDFRELLPTYLSDFWYLLIIWLLLTILSIILYRKVESQKRQKFNWSRIPATTLIWAVLFIIARGGIRPKPIGIIDAASYSSATESPFVLNTPFSLIKTIATAKTGDHKYMSADAALELFNPIQTTVPANILPDSMNVVVIILESFGDEVVGGLNDKTTCTPFLDSLMNESLSFTNCLASGKRSIDALPAIFSSMPAILGEPHLSSDYANNKLDGLANILSDHGYSTAFYHGARNGSMRFDAFAEMNGFQSYSGMDEFDDDSQYDGNWGIFDHAFNPWVAKKISALQEPFCASLFTISAHHPYTIPEDYLGSFNHYDEPLLNAVAYSDYSLKLFFQEARKYNWFENTVFVITADHSPQNLSAEYSDRTKIFRVPLLIYTPNGSIQPEQSQKTVGHTDLMPSILDLTNIQCSYYGMGHSILDSTDHVILNRLNDIYFLFKNEHMTTFYVNRAQKLFNFTRDANNSFDSSSFYKKDFLQNEQLIKAVLQGYDRDLRRNKTCVYE